MFNFDFRNILRCLPTEEILMKEVILGDVIVSSITKRELVSSPILVSFSCQKKNNGEYNWEIQSIGSGTYYFPDKAKTLIVKRGTFDKKLISKLIKDYIKEQKLRAKEALAEENRRYKEEKRYLKERLNNLKR